MAWTWCTSRVREGRWRAVSAADARCMHSTPCLVSCTLQPAQRELAALAGCSHQQLTSLHPPTLTTSPPSVGGDMFDVAVDALAPRGRLIIIGMMSAYADGWVKRQYPGALRLRSGPA